MRRTNPVPGTHKDDLKKTRFTAKPGVQEVLIERSFDTSAEFLFDAFIDPRLIVQWWGPESFSTLIDKLDTNPGGQWRFLQVDGNGHQFAFHGIYHDVVCPERLVYTFEFEGTPGHVVLETVTFSGQEGETLLTRQSVFQSVADRDAMLNRGMKSGSTESMQRLAVLIQKLLDVYP
jgi:uncharacterized protein YndB with AHSA1/START domain